MTQHPPSGDGFLQVHETSLYLSNCVIARCERHVRPVQLHPGSQPDRWRDEQRYETLIEIPIGIAVVGKARHVPMADQMRIGLPNWRATSDIDNSIAIALEGK
jgi:hypothetical protein